MVISKKHKYCFIEYPRSASYAIRNELLAFYDGQDWLKKHSSYKAFADSLPGEYKDYFVFCSIRNPLEDLISIYNINRTNQSGRATAEFYRKHGYPWYLRMRELRRSAFFQNGHDTSFPAFFRKFFAFPYIKPRIVAELDGRFQHVIRVERIQEDFSALLKKLAFEQVRPLPVVNSSTDKKIDLDDYYPSPVRSKAVRVMGPMMKFMNYNFPPHWSVGAIPLSSRLYFISVKPFAAWFWNKVAE